MNRIFEIAPDVYRISVFYPEIDLQFNHFLVKDDEPLLFHTGLRSMFPQVRDAVRSIIPLDSLRHIGFSHFESDECGSLNEWLSEAPGAQALCSMTGALVSVNDFIGRPARGLAHGESFSTGRYRFRFMQTPHVPHGWDAGVLFEETQSTLFCSDLFHHSGDVEPLTTADVVGRSRRALIALENGPLAQYLPFTANTEHVLAEVAALKPRTLALMHGSSWHGDGEQAIRDLSLVFREVLGPNQGAQRHAGGR